MASESTSTGQVPWVLPLSSLGARDVLLAGGKGANLGAMYAAGLPVPPGICVTTAAFREFLSGCPGLAPLLQELGRLAAPGNGILPEAVRRHAQRVRDEICANPLPQAVAAAIVATVTEGVSYAIRSSATAEDLPGASFAGQHDTYLDIRGHEAILDRLRACWASLYSDRAVHYRARAGLGDEAVAAAVVIQEMIPAQVSGVLFTSDPLSGDSSRFVVEACRGLGEALVSGRVSPERLVLDARAFSVLEHRSADGGSNGHLPPWLDTRTLARLGTLAGEARQLFGAPLDIEWAAVDGVVHLLQARPITTLSTFAPIHGFTDGRHRVWSNVNVGEVLPDVATPMTWSVIQDVVRAVFRPLMMRFDIDLDREPMFTLIAGRFYANVGLFAEMLRSLMGSRDMDLRDFFGGSQGDATREDLEKYLQWGRRHGMLHRPKMWMRAAGLLAWLLWNSSPRHGEPRAAVVRRRVQELADLDVTTFADAELIGLVRQMVRELCKEERLLAYVAAGMGDANTFFEIGRRWLGEFGASATNRLVSGAGEMASADAPLALWDLAAWSDGRPALRDALLENESFTALAGLLRQTEEGRLFLERWQAFMATHGHHTRGEVDIHNPRWSETPDYVLRMLRNYLGSLGTVNLVEHRANLERERAHLLAECRRRLGNPIKRAIFTAWVGKARRGLARRENFKSEAVRVLAVIRRVLLEAGERLVRRGVISEGEDVFFLDLDEVEALCGGTAPHDPAARIASRQAEYRRNLALPLPPVIVGQYRAGERPTPPPASPQPAGTVLQGIAVSPGLVTGPARVILRADDGDQVRPGEILVAPFTDPGWAPYFLTASAIVMDLGGMLSHGSIVAREYGIPAVVNVGPATETIRTGQVLRVDGSRGTVTILEDA